MTDKIRFAYPELWSAINAAIRQATKDTETLGLSGIHPEEVESAPYEVLEEMFVGAISEVKRLSAHEHEWTEDLYCSICGADGSV